MIYLQNEPYQVTVNLEAALRRLRKRNQSVVFWIDAICIDQTNEREKSVQIQLMDDIYRKL